MIRSRDYPWLALAVCLLFSSGGYAQVEAPESTPINRIAKLRAVNPVPDGAKVKRRWSTSDAGLDIVPSETGKLAYATSGQAGRYTVTLTEAVATGDNLTLEDYLKVVVFGDVPPQPEPKPKTLAELAGADAPKLAELYRDLAIAVRNESPTAEKFLEGHDKYLTRLELPANPALDSALRKRLAIAVADLPTLADSLDKLAAELQEKPTTPVVVDPEPSLPATSATYVYDYPDMAVPKGVSTGINRLNRERNIRATLFEEGSRDGDGDVPDQYKLALKAANEAGLPAFVVQAGDKVLVVVKDPRTETAIVEAVP